MKVNIISKADFLNIELADKAKFLSKIQVPEVFIIKNFINSELCQKVRNDSMIWSDSEKPSWHKFDDNCPDYHRLHDNYPQAYVMQKFHGFYRHNYYKKNYLLFKAFQEIFVIKNKLAGFDEFEFLNNKPSNGILPRINVHHYPRGGGYQAEHIDPNGPFAQIQSLIVASKFGVDYKTGGVFARKNIGSEKHYLDVYTEIGDMIVLSPAIPHGVEPIDPEVDYSPNSNDGRWIILPLFLHSDYPDKNNIKPKQI
jgi:hypothetical protein